MRRLSTFAIVVVLGVGLGACGKHGAKNVYKCSNKGPGVGFASVKSGKVTVHTSLPATGWWTGTDVDSLTGGYEFTFAQDLCAQLGVGRVRIVNESRANLAAGKGDPFDLAIGQITPTPALQSSFDFSTPYLTSTAGTQYAVMLPKGSANTKLVNAAIAKLKSNGTLTALAKTAP